MTAAHRSLAGFTGAGYDKGRGKGWQILWMVAAGCVTTRWWCPMRLRLGILRLFGAHIGTGALIRHNVRIHWPWKLSVGENSWIGEQAWILNLERVTIKNDVCVSQGVLLCTGSHDRHSPTFEFDNAPIVVEDGAWLATRATVLRGVTVGAGALVGACALATNNIPENGTLLAAINPIHIGPGY